jgi:hypothetical protein
LLTDRNEISNRNRGLSINASYQDSVQLAKSLVSYCSISKTAFPLKPLDDMITHFALIHLQTWLPQAIPVLDWSISKNLLI